MSAQVFRGRTVAEAHSAAVAKLGADAVVLSTRQVVRPGLAGLLGAHDFELAAVPPPPEPTPVASRTSSVGPFARGVYTPGSVAAGPDVGALRAELKGDMRALKTLVARSADNASLASEIGQLRELIEALGESKVKGQKAVAKVRSLGLEGPVAVAVARALGSAAPVGEALREALRRAVRVGAFPATGERSMIAVVGPSGVGKTTTAAKLGAQARAEGRTVLFVACDAFRVGAVEQLSGYARLMGAELVVARTAEELRATIDGARSDLVVVDTSGRPPMADGVELALAPERSPHSARSRHVLLCTTASVRPHDAARIARRFGVLAPTAMAITKIDETDAPAGLLHAPWASRLAVSVLCFGQRVPEDIAPATADAIVDHLAPRANDKAAAA